MDRDAIRQALIDAIDQVAPGAVADGFDPDNDMREEFDLDSMDILNIVTALHERIGIDIPESDLDQIASLKRAVDYLERRTQG